MVKKQQVDIAKDNALERLSYYAREVDEIYEDIRKLDSIASDDAKKAALDVIKEKYKSIKSSLSADLKELEKYNTVGIASRFYEPALRDMLHNSTLLPVNQVTFNNIEKLQQSLYDIQDYANYWAHQLKGYKE